MLRQCSVQYVIEIHKLQTKLGAFEARGVTNFATRCTNMFTSMHPHSAISSKNKSRNYNAQKKNNLLFLSKSNETCTIDLQ